MSLFPSYFLPSVILFIISFVLAIIAKSKRSTAAIIGCVLFSILTISVCIYGYYQMSGDASTIDLILPFAFALACIILIVDCFRPAYTEDTKYIEVSDGAKTIKLLDMSDKQRKNLRRNTILIGLFGVVFLILGIALFILTGVIYMFIFAFGGSVVITMVITAYSQRCDDRIREAAKFETTDRQDKPKEGIANRPSQMAECGGQVRQ